MKEVSTFEPILKQYRANYLECVHYGIACVVDEKGIRYSLGDPDWYSFYRSVSKPIQALPTLMAGLPEKYGLTDEETAIFSGSHWGEPHHIEILESIMTKTDLKEEDMIMLPTYPLNEEVKRDLLRKNMPPRKLYHNCSGKHLSLMLLSRELEGKVENYWKVNTPAQTAILNVIAKLADMKPEDIHIGVDGCGVPVYGIPIKDIAKTFLRVACPELIEDEELRKAVIFNRRCIKSNSSALDGKKGPCAVMSKTGDIVAKAGALGVYAFGSEKLRIGAVVKMSDGSDPKAAYCSAALLKQLGYDSNMINDLETVLPSEIYNDNKIKVGYQECLIPKL